MKDAQTSKRFLLFLNAFGDLEHRDTEAQRFLCQKRGPLCLRVSVFYKNFLIAQLHHLHVLELGAIDGEAHQGTHLVETIVARCTGVDVEHVERLVILHLQDVRMSADEEFGRAHHQASHNRGVVFARIATDVFHHHLGLLHGEAQGLRVEPADVLSVDVAIHRP